MAIKHTRELCTYENFIQPLPASSITLLIRSSIYYSVMYIVFIVPILNLRSYLPSPKKKPMRQKQVEHIEYDQRQTIIPRQPPQNLIHRTRNHRPHHTHHPTPSQNPHIPILIILMRLRIPRRDPSQRSAEKSILDSREVCIRLDYHDELDVKAVAGFAPASDGDDGVEDRGDCEGEVVVADVLGATPEHEDSGEGVHEDAEGDGGVVHHSAEVADFLDGVEFAAPEVHIR